VKRVKVAPANSSFIAVFDRVIGYKPYTSWSAVAYVVYLNDLASLTKHRAQFLPCSDFVLVYEEEIQTVEEKKAGKIGKKKDKSEMTEKDYHDMWRQKFMSNLIKIGVQFEEV